MALACSVRDRMLARWMSTVRAYAERDVKIVCYLSAEFLTGPQLGNNLVSLGIEAAARAAMRSLGQDLDALLALEEEPGLGNGGLGRLAACYMDSLATLQVPAIGFGIRYEFGIFDQEIRDGWQVEVTDKWLQKGNPWEIVPPETSFYVNFGGYTEPWTDSEGRYRVRWVPAGRVKGVPRDTPVLGYRVNTCNTLRLWKSEAVESFDFQDFNVGDYYGAVEQKTISETLSKVLYPNDEPEIGKRLRLAQQYFFVSCSLQNILRLLDMMDEPAARLPDLFAVQLNDTHPSIAVAELMRLLARRRGSSSWRSSSSASTAVQGPKTDTRSRRSSISCPRRAIPPPSGKRERCSTARNRLPRPAREPRLRTRPAIVRALPSTRRHRLALAQAGALKLCCSVRSLTLVLQIDASVEAQVRDVSAKQHGPRPLDKDPQLAAERGHLRQIVRAPQEPGGEAPQGYAEHLRDAPTMTDRGHRSALLILKRAGRFAADRREEVLREAQRLAYRELGRWGSDSAVSGVADPSAVTHSPRARDGWHREVAIDDDSAALERQRRLFDQRVGRGADGADDAGCCDHRAIREQHSALADHSRPGIHLDLNAPLSERAMRRVPQPLGQLGKQPLGVVQQGHPDFARRHPG